MTAKEKQIDANQLMDLEMMETITGGAQMCAEGCLLVCLQSCFLSKKERNTPKPTPTPTVTNTPTPTEPTKPPTTV